MPSILVYDADGSLPGPLEREIRSALDLEWLGPSSAGDGEPLIERTLNPTYFVVVEENSLRSFARTIWARVTYCSQELKLYGLGDVVTVRSQRRKGYGAMVTQAATAHIKADADADAALLLTQPELERFYAQWGWVHLPQLRVVTEEADDPGAEPPFVMLLFCSNKARRLRALFADNPLVLPGDEW